MVGREQPTERKRQGQLGTQESEVSADRVPVGGGPDLLFTLGTESRANEERMREREWGKPILWISFDRILFKYQFSGNVEIFLAPYCELDVPVSREKGHKDHWVRVGLLTTPTNVLG